MENFEKFYNVALRFLSFRPRSEREVRDNLRRKKTDPQLIEKVIAKLKEQKFIDDEKFVEWWIEQRTTFKPRSFRLIKLELRQKGIDGETIDKIFNFQFSIFNEKENVKKLIDKKMRRFTGLSKEEVYQKLGRYLATKGFDWNTIKESIDELVSKGV